MLGKPYDPIAGLLTQARYAKQHTVDTSIGFLKHVRKKHRIQSAWQHGSASKKKEDDGELTQTHNVVMHAVKEVRTETFLGFFQIVAKHFCKGLH